MPLGCVQEFPWYPHAPYPVQIQPSPAITPQALQEFYLPTLQSILIRCRFISISASSTVTISLLSPDRCLPLLFSLRFSDTRSRCRLSPLPKFRMTTKDQKRASTVMAIDSTAKIVKDYDSVFAGRVTENISHLSLSFFLLLCYR